MRAEAQRWLVFSCLTAMALPRLCGCEASPPTKATPDPGPSTYDPEWRKPPLKGVTLSTPEGPLRCTLDGDGSALARFSGYVRGTTRFRQRDGWVERPAFDAAPVQRVERDRFWLAGPVPLPATPPAATPTTVHREAGQLSLHPEVPLVAITAGPAQGLDRAGFVPLGRCTPTSTAVALSRTPSRHGRPDVPGATLRSVEPLR